MSQLRRNILFVPSRGWVRFRSWLGASREQIAAEVQSLHLPGYVPSPQEVVAGVLLGAPAAPLAPHLAVIDGGPALKKGKPAKPARKPKNWDHRAHMVTPGGASPGRDEYVAENRLDYYAETDAGRQAARNALSLWCEGGDLRELAIDALLAGDTPREVAELVRKHAPPAKRVWLRNVDVTAFRDLFWDFRGLGPPQIAAFVVNNPVSAYGAVALGLGTDAVLQRMGKQDFAYSTDSAKHMIEQVLCGWLQHQVRQPEQADVLKLKAAADLVEKLSLLGKQPAPQPWGAPGATPLLPAGTPDVAAALSKIGPRIQHALPIPTLQQIMQEATLAQRREDIELALSIGVVTPEEYEQFRDSIDNGVDIGAEVRDKIAAAKASIIDVDDLPSATPIPSASRR